ncbi:MAG: DinB family protein [Bacteroidota bacterium]
MAQDISHLTQLLKTTRNNIQRLMDAFTIEQLNQIPNGFNNNLIWNYGHVVITHQLLIYGLSGLPMKVDNELVAKYRKGTKPETQIDSNEYDYLKNLFHELPEITLADYEQGIFQNYKRYETSFGATLEKVEDGILFNNMHEAMHFGTMLSIRKFI